MVKNMTNIRFLLAVYTLSTALFAAGCSNAGGEGGAVDDDPRCQPGGTTCEPDDPSAPCSDTNLCPTNAQCVDGACIANCADGTPGPNCDGDVSNPDEPECSDTKACESGLACFDGECVAECDAGQTAAICEEAEATCGFIADDSASDCVADCGTCEEGTLCGGSGVPNTCGAATDISAGEAHTCSTMNDGSVWCWGRSHEGQLGGGDIKVRIGDDETPDSQPLVPVGGDVRQIAVGIDHTCALLESGGVKCWGEGSSGQLGYGNRQDIGDDEEPSSVGEVELGEPAQQLVVGDRFSCALLESGDVRCWGFAAFGRLGHPVQDGDEPENIGDDETPDSFEPLDLGGPATQLSAGLAHACALLESKEVVCWGLGATGRLGYGNSDNIGDNEDPAQAGVVQLGGPASFVAAGESHTCAILEEVVGTSTVGVKCWGSASSGELGYGAAVTTSIGENETPESVGTISLVAEGEDIIPVSLSLGRSFSCAIFDSKDVRCWGNDGRGELANGAFFAFRVLPSTTPLASIGGPVDKLAAGGRHACAALESGELLCWGSGAEDLGYGDTRDIGNARLPADVGAIEIGDEVVDVDSSETHSCAVFASGGVRCWGRGPSGELGYGADVYPQGKTSPEKVDLGDVQISNIVAGRKHTCALDTDGNVRCWGEGVDGQLGSGNRASIGDDEDIDELSPIDLGGAVKQLVAGDFHNCALLVSGGVRCWGQNGLGQLGLPGQGNIIGDDELPLDVPEVSIDEDKVINELVAGHEHTCALFSDGTIRCWGANDFGQLGLVLGEDNPNYGDEAGEEPSAAPLVDVGSVVLTDLELGAAMAAGDDHTCVISEAGIRCWGDAEDGQLGYGNVTDIGKDDVPSSLGDQYVEFSDPAVQLAADRAHTCVLLEGGRVYCWGNSLSGQLGYGAQEFIGDDELPSSQDPVDVGGTVTKLEAGYGHTCAILDSGAMTCWGNNFEGQLGYGNNDGVGANRNSLPSTAGPIFK